MSTVQS